MRLIDADELLKALNTQDTFGYSCKDLFELSKGMDKDYVPYTRFDDVIKCINNMPTAYDVDKVVEQLEENAHDMEICEEQHDMNTPYFMDVQYKMVKLEDAIEIVKAGGRNDD